MKILVLSCNTGGGHNSCGLALVQAAEAAGHCAVMEDFMTLFGGRFSRKMGNLYVWIVKNIPFAFGLIYNLGELISSNKRKSPVYYANRNTAKRLWEHLEREKFDVILAPHIFPTEALSILKARGKKIPPVIAIATDYTCTPFWEETDCDYFVTPGERLNAEFIKKGIAKERLLPFGIPTRADFAAKKSRAEARRQLGLREDGKLYLIMSGSMGFGRVEQLAARLERSRPGDSTMVIICGSDKRLHDRLKKQFNGIDSVIIEGFTDSVADYLSACDVVFTKPGGLSSTEAAARRVPIVHTSPIPGCETRNSAYFKANGMSLAPRGIKNQVAAGLRLAEDAALAEKMRTAQSKNVNPDTAAEIMGFISRYERAGDNNVC